MKDFPKSYEAKLYEDNIYQMWEKSGAFTPKVDPQKKPFSIAMPPPNATGTLHLGHATMLALEDIMIRYKRMQGFSALWLPGTDHAAIATQTKVEQILLKEGLTRQKLGRQEFLQRVHSYVAESRNTIRKQIRKMGSSCDWSRERYTLDEGLSDAVSEIFVRMYHDGLIYRGHRIVNWCPRCSSTLADDEVVYKEVPEKLYYIAYGPLTLATVRPETKFGDTAVAVHPKDPRYKKYVGKMLIIQTVLGEAHILVIADPIVDRKFGTGVIKVTPAHDPTDFDIAQRHKLEIRQVIDESGRMNEKAGKYAGMTTAEARKAVVSDMKELGILKKEEDYTHNLSLCYRCSTVIEPLVSLQWFVDVNKPVIPGPRGKKYSLKEKAVSVVKKKEIAIIPDRFQKTYFHWMENLRDWCISRQIWFGHRIPVWYCLGDTRKGAVCKIACGKPVVQVEQPEKCPHCGSSNFRQDPDTLDTWFSSGLWTFSTLGWPSKTEELRYFHPTSVLETGYDILFFWVARMILMTTYALGDVPFRTVYLHGLVQDKEGKKMSKSLDNGIDPLDMIEKFGADAVRLSLVLGSTPGNNLRLYEEKIAGYRNFVNKMWNAARFVFMNVGEDAVDRTLDVKNFSVADKWILHRTNELITKVTQDLDQFRFSDAGLSIYNFTWDEFCDWYLECSKVQGNPAVLLYVLDVILRLLHPFMPFVTEVIWRNLGPNSLLLTQKWPKTQQHFSFPKEADQMNLIFDVIRSIRKLRNESHVEASKKIRAFLFSEKYHSLLGQKADIVKRMAGLSELQILDARPDNHDAVTAFVSQVEIFLPFEDMVDVKSELQRLDQEEQKVLKYRAVLEKKLLNKNFIQNAPKEIVEGERSKLQMEEERLEKIREQKKQLMGSR